MKRTIDVIAAGIGVILVLPLLPIIALAIYVNSPGPIFYRQRRAGRLIGVSGHNKFEFVEFDMFKFRSMHVNAEKLTGAILAREGDPRVTSVGRFLRKTRLDELPQLWNVLRGDMSLVGPRPERPELLSNLAAAIPFFEERMRGVRPGITGLAQISLGYSGGAKPGSEIEPFVGHIANPFELGDEAHGAEADDMRLKLLYDMAYVAALESFRTFLPMELRVMIMTPVVMLRGVGR
jgi:lipopolysaccharide/colanic/teichoic acid biosynthesis glycosyltransferase